MTILLFISYKFEQFLKSKHWEDTTQSNSHTPIHSRQLLFKPLSRRQRSHSPQNWISQSARPVVCHTIDLRPIQTAFLAAGTEASAHVSPPSWHCQDVSEPQAKAQPSPFLLRLFGDLWCGQYAPCGIWVLEWHIVRTSLKELRDAARYITRDAWYIIQGTRVAVAVAVGGPHTCRPPAHCHWANARVCASP